VDTVARFDLRNESWIAIVFCMGATSIFAAATRTHAR
jgi:hypothetical protein